MKKVLYFTLPVLIFFSCNKKNDYQEALDCEKRLNEIENQYDTERKNGDLTAEQEAQFEKEYDEQFEKVKEAYTVFFKNNINNDFGQEIFKTSIWYRRLSLKQLESVLENANDSFKATELYRKSSERVNNMKTATVGNIYKDFTSKDPAGNEIALSEFVGKGKYILLDFWASWCPPCREEMPGMVKLYEEYKSKDFDIVGYSLDKSEEAWKKGIEFLGLGWTQMSDCAFWDSPAAKLYAVQSIPCTILIDPDGKIVERGLIGSELSEKLKELIK
ncbi:MAG: TlpA family protein disulfide reductase [Dysgonamonadaceae bacterium]|jgi:thiol-disulfide isomerase/thioredoxin|nr:TlpA family protein disulfide reductase [Dysgonamonadaceae bacterium]